MKLKLLLAIILLVLIVGGGVGQILLVNHTMNYISDDLEELKIEVLNGYFDIEQVHALQRYWEKILPVLETIIPNTDIDQVATLMAELEGAIENEDGDETHIRIEVLQIRVESIKHLLSFRIEHVL